MLIPFLITRYLNFCGLNCILAQVAVSSRAFKIDLACKRVWILMVRSSMKPRWDGRRTPDSVSGPLIWFLYSWLSFSLRVDLALRSIPRFWFCRLWLICFLLNHWLICLWGTCCFAAIGCLHRRIKVISTVVCLMTIVLLRRTKRIFCALLLCCQPFAGSVFGLMNT